MNRIYKIILPPFFGIIVSAIAFFILFYQDSIVTEQLTQDFEDYIAQQNGKKTTSYLNLDTIHPVVILDTVIVEKSVVDDYEVYDYNPNFFERNESIIWMLITSIFAISTLVSILNRFPARFIKLKKYRTELYLCRIEIQDLMKKIAEFKHDLTTEMFDKIEYVQENLERNLNDFIFTYKTSVCNKLKKTLISNSKNIQKLSGLKPKEKRNELKTEIKNLIKILNVELDKINSKIFKY